MPPLSDFETGVSGPTASLICDDRYPALRAVSLRPGKMATSGGALRPASVARCARDLWRSLLTLCHCT